jgi:hypothetical protein
MHRVNAIFSTVTGALYTCTNPATFVVTTPLPKRKLIHHIILGAKPYGSTTPQLANIACCGSTQSGSLHHPTRFEMTCSGYTGTAIEYGVARRFITVTIRQVSMALLRKRFICHRPAMHPKPILRGRSNVTIRCATVTQEHTLYFRDLMHRVAPLRAPTPHHFCHLTATQYGKYQRHTNSQ